MRPPRSHRLVFLVLAAALALPAAASANDFQDVYRDYKRGGTIKPCRFSNEKLANAERQTPPDVEQYAPSFLDALQTARERGADCGKEQAAAAPAPASTTPSVTPPAASAPEQSPAPEPAPATSTTTVAQAPPPAPSVPAAAKVAGVPSPPLAAAAAKDDSAPGAVWLLAALAALAVLSAVFAGLAWWFGWGADGILRPWGASWSDFGGRLADLGGEFRDWVRSGY